MFKFATILLFSTLVWANEGAHENTVTDTTTKETKTKLTKTGKAPIVEIKTSKGIITVELNKDKSPKTVENFLKYTKEKFYDGTIFHRVIDGFMIQGGGFKPDLSEKTTHESIPNEAGDSGLNNDKYTIAMARTSDPHSATAQFFINVKDNGMLNFRSKTPGGYGYAVFGKVIGGTDVVDKIKAVTKGKKNTPDGQEFDDVPTETVKIESIRLKK